MLSSMIAATRAGSVLQIPNTLTKSAFAIEVACPLSRATRRASSAVLCAAGESSPPRTRIPALAMSRVTRETRAWSPSSASVTASPSSSVAATRS